MTPTSRPRTALITGASSGIGAEFARRLAASGYRLVLVARDAGALNSHALELDGERDGERNGEPVGAGSTAIEVLSADLTDHDDRARVVARLSDDSAPIDLLVNNAGLGLGRTVTEVTADELLHQLELNVTAVLLLTHAALPGMLRRDHGAIINVASVAAVTPSPSAAYGASKAWVLSFTEGVALAVQGTGVRVQALCPGLVRTDFHRRAGMEMAGTPSFTWVEVARLVCGSHGDLARNTAASVPGALYKTIVGDTKVLPRRWVRAMSRQVDRRRPGSSRA